MIQTCADHLIERISEHVAYVSTRHCHQYFTLRKPPGQYQRRVVACNGSGYVHPGHVENYLPAEVEREITKILGLANRKTVNESKC